jgi:transcriptional regulator GlxA family with amidase domain
VGKYAKEDVFLFATTNNNLTMRIAYILFDGITLLDFIGIYDPISRLKSMNFLPDLSWDVCAFSNTVKDSFGLEITPDKINNDLSVYNVLIVPGGFGVRSLLRDEEFLTWFRKAEAVELKVSICTGSLLLGAAGFLADKRATTNYQEYETLKPFCREVVRERIVDDQTVITSGAVSASIDLGLYLCDKWCGPQAKEEIRKKMDYRH